MTLLPPEKDRRKQSRRIADRATEDLNKTFSSSHCYACLERLNDAVLLLDNERKFLYATSQMYSIINSSKVLFTLTPSFALLTSHNNLRIQDFFNENNNQINPLVLQLISEKSNGVSTLTVFRLSAPSEPDLHVARFLIKIQNVSGVPIQQWSFFIEQFSLTTAEIMLCRALTDGFTLKDYSINSGVTVHTLRSQLKSIFTKTSTRRQVDLLRLINLFL